MTEESLFHEALAKSPQERDAFLDAACAGQPELRAAVGALLSAHEQPGSLLDSPAVADATSDVAAGRWINHADALRISEGPGSRIGPYKLLQQIGEGGMGVVYMAEQDKPVRRKVALKIIKPGMDSVQVIARFEAERQALALMDHQNIARVLDAGTTTSGRPYFVMELVKGVPITKFCDDNHLTPRERLELFVPVCQAIQHAHQKGIIHRDVKPSNILVTLYDGKPVPKVIDFGVAKAIQQRLTERTLFTQFGQVVGTVEYMSPEQAEQSALDIDTRSDIYSLGVLLYELLTGSTPLEKQKLRKAAFHEMLRMIREEEPPRPSTRLSASKDQLPTISAQRKMEPAKLTKLVHGELDWIVMKALEKDRGRRYETANGFAMDVQRYLADEPVLACPPSAGYRLRKFIRKNRRPVIAAALILLSVVGGAIGAIYGVIESGKQRTAALQRQIEDEQRAAAERDRHGRNAEAVSALLDQTEQGLRANDPGRAAVTLAAAEKRFAEGGAEGHGLRLDQLRDDLALLRALDEVDQFRWTPADNGWRPLAGAVAARLREVLGRFRLGPGSAAPDELARRIGGSTLRDRLVAALDRVLAAEQKAAVRAVLRAADPDGFRDPVRDAMLAGDGTALTNVASRPEAAGQPPGFISVLGENEAIPAKKRRQMLTAAVQRRPADLDLLMAIGGLPVDHQIPEELKGKDPKERYPWLKAANAADAWERLRWVQAAVAVAPANPVTHSQLGAVLNATGNADGAIAELREAIRLDPKYVGASFVLANTLHQKGDLDGTITVLKEAIRANPEHSSSLQYNLNGYMKKKGDPAGAITAYRELVRRYPKDPRHRNTLGVALWEKGDPDEAIAEFREAIRIDPNYARVHWSLGQALRRKGHLDGAIAEHREALRLGMKEPDILHSSLGNALLEKGDLDAAVAVFLEAIRLAPDSAQAHLYLGTALRLTRDATGAIAAFREAIRLSPQQRHALAHSALAAVLAQGPDGVRDGKLAVEHATQACESNVWTNPRFIGILAAAYAEAGQFDKAIEYQKKALAFPDYAQTYGAVMRKRLDLYSHGKPYRDPVFAGPIPDSPAAYDKRGDVLVETRNMPGAAAAYRAEIRLAPNSALAHYKLGRVLHAVGDLDGATAAYREAARLDGKHRGAAIDALAELLRSCGNMKEAVATCRTIVALDPKDAHAHVRLGNALKAKGDLDEAAAAYRAAAAMEEKKNPAGAGDLYNAACCRALTAAAQTQAGGADAARLAKEEADRAMVQLTKAVAAGYADAVHMGLDDDLNPLRDRDDFRKLVADVVAKLPPLDQARYYVRLSQWDKAAAAYAKADLLARPLNDDAFAYACLFLIRGDSEGYNHFCQRMIQRVDESKNSFEAYVLARSCAIARKSPVDPARAVQWANQAVASTHNPWDYHVLGLAQYRAGQFNQASPSFAKARVKSWIWELDWFGLALVQQRKGIPGGARQYLANGIQWLERQGAPSPERPAKLNPQDWIEAQLLRREAEELLKTKASP